MANKLAVKEDLNISWYFISKYNSSRIFEHFRDGALFARYLNNTSSLQLAFVVL